MSFDSLYSYLAPEFIFSNVPVEVESFRVTINSGKKSKVIEVKTSAFNTELSTAFQNISEGDMILLDVNVKYAGIRSNIQPFKFTVHILK